MLGTGLIKGLAVTAKNLVGSYHDPARYTTLEYPEVKPKLPEAYRNFPFLVTENATDPMGTLRCGRLPDLREGMPAAVHLHREEQGQEARRPRASPDLPGGLRHRHLRLHELPDLRRGLPV